MSDSLKAARSAYAKRDKEIQSIAARVKTWRAELTQCNSDAARLDELRLQALMRGDDSGAEKYASDLEKCKARQSDLERMIERGTADVTAALAAQWKIEGAAILAAEFEQLAADQLAAKLELEKAAPAYNRAVANYAALEAKALGISGLDSECRNIQNCKRWVDEQLAIVLRGETIEQPYIPTWLQNGKKEM